jgi:hypothetical protein
MKVTPRLSRINRATCAALPRLLLSSGDTPRARVSMPLLIGETVRGVIALAAIESATTGREA